MAPSNSDMISFGFGVGIFFENIRKACENPLSTSRSLWQQSEMLAPLTCHHATSMGRPSHPPLRPFFLRWPGLSRSFCRGYPVWVGLSFFYGVGAWQMQSLRRFLSAPNIVVLDWTLASKKHHHGRLSSTQTGWCCLCTTANVLRNGNSFQRFANNSPQSG